MADSQYGKFAIETVTTALGNRINGLIKCKQLAFRAVELTLLGDMGYQLISTLHVKGDGSVTILDTLLRKT